MSKRNYYDPGNGKYSRKGRKKEILATEEMLNLIKTSKIYRVYDPDTISIHNGKASGTIIVDYTGDPYAIVAASGLDHRLVKSFGCTKDIAHEWIGLFGDELQRLFENGDLEDEDESDKKPNYIHKYTLPDGRLIEAVIVGGKPYFILMKEGSELDFDLLSEYPISDKILKPMVSYLAKPYDFESREEIVDYLKLAYKACDGRTRNFDTIFRLVNTIFKKYVVLENHHITFLVSDIIYTYFQDMFGTTHYDMCVGDNGSGKNSILTAFGKLGYRFLMATSVSEANIISFLGNVQACQGCIAEDEADNLHNNPTKMNMLKSGYSISSSLIPKTDLSSGRTQDAFHSYCFKIFASESALDNLKAKGLLDRTFEIPCLVGIPTYNIKEVDDRCYEPLRKELEKTRKLLFACRMVYHRDIIEDVTLNIFNREAELTKPSIRLFQHSPGVLKELLPALTKCLDAKRKVKSTSMEAVLYTTLCNLTDDKSVGYKEAMENLVARKGEIKTENELLINESNGWKIDYALVIWEFKRLTYARDIPGKDGEEVFQCDLGKITHRKVIDTLVQKFNAERTSIGTGNNKRKALSIIKKNLDRKRIDYNVPVEIKILPYVNNIPPGPDSFDSIISDGEFGTDGTESKDVNEKDERAGTHGTDGTEFGGMGCEIHDQESEKVEYDECVQNNHSYSEFPNHQSTKETHNDWQIHNREQSESLKSFGFKDPNHRQVLETTRSEEVQAEDNHIASDTPSNEPTFSKDIKSSHIPQNSVPTVPSVPASTNSGTERFASVPPVPEDSTQGEPKLPNLPEMPEFEDDGMDVMSEEDIESFKKPPNESFNPIVSVKDFFRDDLLPLPDHSIEQSPCFHVIDIGPGEISTNTVYYCKLHPELGSNFLNQIELHCREKEPDIHKAAILEELGESA